jgi:hypothetical protein
LGEIFGDFDHAAGDAGDEREDAEGLEEEGNAVVAGAERADIGVEFVFEAALLGREVLLDLAHAAVDGLEAHLEADLALEEAVELCVELRRQVQ